MRMSIKEYMKDLNNLKPEHQLLTIAANINELFYLLREIIKINTLKKSIIKKSNLFKKLESIKSTIKSALLTYNDQIYSSDEEGKESNNEEHKKYIESSDKEYIESTDQSVKASFGLIL